MEQLSKVSVILPSFNPGAEIMAVVKHAVCQGFGDVFVVNDGSSGEHSAIFDEVAKIGGCTVLRHDVNRGKGAALKTGMAYFLENRPDGLGVVTVDDDGQHRPEDVRLCAEAMASGDVFVLGSRDFKKPSVPAKSRIGNLLSAKLFKVWVGLDVSDSQTGLRAVPRKYVDTLLDVPGDRFEYETNMLIAAKKERFDMTEIPIDTVYVEGNKGTRFRAMTDSFAVVLQLVKYAQGSLASSFIDLASFYAFLNLLSWHPLSGNWNVIFLSTVLARVLSSVFNFFFNKNIVFRHKGKGTVKAALRYYALCGASMALSGSIVALSSYILLAGTARFVTLVKVVVDSVLFFMNYHVQRKWVFK